MLQEKSLLVCWAGKSHNATIIMAKMEGYFGTSVPSYRWRTKWLRAHMTGEDTLEPNKCSGGPEVPLTGLKVVDFLNSNLFASVRQIATATKILWSNVFDH
jgi:hypothetical protein